MRHLVKGRKLGRTASHRKATMQALAIALIQERRIQTTVPKAKELRRFVEPLITRAKVDSTHNRREVFSRLNDKYTVTELFEEVGPKAKDRPGGYTRVIKLGYRSGDAAELAMIELVDYNDVPPAERQGKTRRTRRAGRSKGSSSDSGASTASASAEKAEAKQSDEKEKKGSSANESSSPTSADFKVDEVKEKLNSMSDEEATLFAGEDERVTVQKALNKKLEPSSDDQDSEDQEEDK